MSTDTGPDAGPRDAPQPGLLFAAPSEAGGASAPSPDARDTSGPSPGFPAGQDASRTVGAPAVHEREIRPRRRLRWWQTLPIAVVAILGSLMFAFPLAFESGGGGPLVGMLGLLLTAASAGWGAMAARRAGYTWPGLPRRGTGARAGWRVPAAYTVLAIAVVGLAVLRVARLRG